MKDIMQKRALCGKSLYSFICDNAARQGGEVYLFNERVSLTHGRALRIIAHTALCLKNMGVGKGSFVAVRAERRIETALAFAAIVSIGAVAVMTDCAYPPEEALSRSGTGISAQYIVGFSGGDKPLCDLSVKCGGKLLCLPLEEGSEGDAERVKLLDDAVPADDPSLIIFTSGSTGRSKAVVLSRRNYITNSVDGGDLFEEGPGDLSVLVLPLHHIFGLSLIVCSTVNGHGIFFPSSIECGYVSECIERYSLSVIYSVPTYFLSLISCEACRRRDLSSLRYGLIAGGPSTRRQAEDIERALGCVLVPVYGMSEFVGITTMPYSASAEERCSGVGRWYPLNEGWILGDDGSELPVGAAGEVCVSGGDLMLGYYNDPAATRAVIDEKGRLHTGDIGYLDERGILHLCGRKKDIIIRGGENISAAEVERALLEVEGVNQAAVVGIADERYGEVPVALVTLSAGFTLTERDILSAVSPKLRGYEVPVRLAVADSLPLTSSGKIDKLSIKEWGIWKTA